MAKLKLTDRVVATIECPPGKRNHLFPDVSGNGLCLYVSAAGAKLWRYRYDFAGRRNETITLGDARLMGYEEAKAQAFELHRWCRVEKRDPKLWAYRPREAVTLNDVLDAYVEKLAATAKATVTSSLKPVRAKFGRTPLRDLTRKPLKDWAEGHYAAKDGKAARGGAARTMVRYLCAAINDAMADETVVLPPEWKNPAARLNSELDVVTGRTKGSHAVAWEDDEFAAIFGAIQRAYDEERWHQPGVMMVELALLTGARPLELQTLTWDQIDDVPGAPDMKWIVKDRHKTWKRTKRPRRITVSPAGVAVLDAARAWANKHRVNSPYVFPARRTQVNTKVGHFNSPNQLCRNLSTWAGLDFRPYNLRSAYINHSLGTAEASDAASFQAALQVVAENVSHTNTKMTLDHYVLAKGSKVVEAVRLADVGFAKYRRSPQQEGHTTQTGL